ncbi:protein obstructor-E-like isoform X2 [Biomphalaria pfeifferi]|uniref:Protein obstructor-E-like isoform X2 n=1 Tax=Biomphalaria pfeifferi TaxID=112525 RepID=A0AAD8EVG9_BIOPF|nr:protein obstructor-E-like isoform X2 [Biomphalaria pfeifferi]
MNWFLKLVSFLALVLICYGKDTNETSCTKQLNGWIAEIGCWGYNYCENGTLVPFVCPPSTVYDRDTKKCVPPGSNTTACGTPTICSGLPSGRYPDIGCKSYYVCYEGVNNGRIYCPASLVFDSTLGLCNWAYNVPPPCGTKKD